VEKLIKRAEAGQVKLFVDRLVAAEIIWVLASSVYRFSMSRLAEILVPFFSSEDLEVEDRSLIIGAIELSRDKNVDFIDAYLALKAAALDEEIATFDRSDFGKLPARWRIPE
jgi:predicted nucleic acid-binding protein